MPRRPPYLPALAAAAIALAAAACSAPAATAGIQRPATTATAGAAAGTSAAAVALAAAGGTTITAGPAPVFTGLAFPTAGSGWLLGSPSDSPGRAQVWHTGTAGASWQVQWKGAGSPLSITATDPAHAWALIACPGTGPSCGRELLATTDGGARWHVAATLPQPVNEVWFASGHLGIATSDSCLSDRALSSCPGQVLVSDDGGARWTAVLRGASPIFATANAAGQLWAAQTSPGTFGRSGPGPSGIKFLTSTDGGRSWTRLGQLTSAEPFTPEVQVSLAAAASGPAGLAWASVFDPLSCAMHGCAVASLLHSGDGGRSWRPVSLPDSHPDGCADNGIMFSAAPDGSAWAAAGRNGAACAPPFGLVYRYGSAGWQQLPPWPLTQVSGLAAVSKDVAYAISGPGTLTRTGDGGMRWTQLLPVPVPVGQVDAVSPATALAAQDAADAGAILRSDDGGRSWRQVAALPGVVTHLDFWSAADGVAAVYQPGGSLPWRLWATTDGGSVWAPSASLPGGSTAIDGPWLSAGGRGLLLTVTSGAPWDPGSGGIPPARVWTTRNYGLSWQSGSLLPLGGDTVGGPASFAPYAGPPGGPVRWYGWLVVSTPGLAQRLAVSTGGALTLFPASVPASSMQLISPGTGFAWELDTTGNAAVTILSLDRTTDGGRRWQHASIRLVTPPGPGAVPLLGFSDACHGWLVLGAGTWRTDDGGLAWTRG